jgi:hemoglobin
MTTVTTSNDATLFANLGGAPAIAAAVDEFYRRVLADLELAPFFLGVDMDMQRRKQIEFLTTALGGPSIYKGPTIRRAHAGLAIQDRHFDRVAGHLTATLRQLGVGSALVDDVIAVVATLRSEVVANA